MTVGGYSIADFVAYDGGAWRSLMVRYLTEDAVLAFTVTIVVLVATIATVRTNRLLFVYLALAVSWLWIGVRFHGHWHQQLNWAAHYWCWAWVFQSVLLAFAALLSRSRRVLADTLRWYQWLFLAVVWLLPPLLSWFVFGNSIHAFEIAGATPDPTAWLTIVVLWLIEVRITLALVLSVIPVLSLVVSYAFATVIDDGTQELLHLTTLASLIAVIVMRCYNREPGSDRL